MQSAHHNKGFVSAAVSAAILMLGIVCAIGITMMGSRLKNSGNKKVEASDSARKKLEELLNQPWSSLSNGSNGDLTWTVTTQGTSNRLKQITVTFTRSDSQQTPGTSVVAKGFKYDDF